MLCYIGKPVDAHVPPKDSMLMILLLNVTFELSGTMLFWSTWLNISLPEWSTEISFPPLNIIAKHIGRNWWKMKKLVYSFADLLAF